MNTSAIFKYQTEEDYAHMINDVVKMITILVIVNILMFINNPTDNALLSLVYLKLCVFIVLGIVTYWLIVKNILFSIKKIQ
jgi:hypothetical protein|tara:strand:+ start:40 stop:282 length:243 start_codon:yes stop_codon:yes gene_type:complete